MAETVVLRVAMSCQGCVGAVKRVLTKMEGVESFDVDLQEQKVTVKGDVTPETVFQTVSKSGKKTSFWEEEAKEPAPAPEAEAAPEPVPEAEAAPEPVPEAAPDVAASAAAAAAAATA
ncbi:copper transport protein ATX1-like [Curcuma longa]|uniref:copper transport protein ATX1-like n=1 Tax=Curcuma longa TaxID=136217 RepID=UPI003D9E37B2